jgi:glycosyltransferase involved in cell wall biosynthesis
MRIALATHALAPAFGGPTVSVPAVGKRLVELGESVQYWSVDSATYVPEGQRGTPAKPWEAELVHAFGAWTPFMHLACTSARWSRRPLVFAPIGMFEPWAIAQKKWKKRLAWHAYQRTDVARAAVIHATSAAELQSIRGLGLKNPIAVIPHGVDTPSELVARSTDKPRRKAVFMSRIEPKKGVAELLRAWSVLRPSHWDLWIVGPDHRGYRSVVENMIAELRLGPSVQLRDAMWGDAKYQLLCSADLFVLPTYSENFGLVVPEAMAHGAPVLTTRGAPWSELTESQSGWWIDVGYEPLLKALAVALATPVATLHAMGLRGRALVRERYDWDAVSLRHSALYRFILGRGPRPDTLVDA